MLDTFFAWSLLLFAPLVFAYAGSSDLFSMRISNRIALIFLLPFPLFAFGIDMALLDVAKHFGTGFVVLAVAFGFWAAGWIGGGDAKFTAVAALWIGPDTTVMFIALTAIYGAVLALIFMQLRSKIMPFLQYHIKMLREVDWIDRLMATKRIPYGLALSAAGLQIYASSDWMQAGIERLI